MLLTSSLNTNGLRTPRSYESFSSHALLSPRSHLFHEVTMGARVMLSPASSSAHQPIAHCELCGSLIPKDGLQIPQLLSSQSRASHHARQRCSTSQTFTLIYCCCDLYVYFDRERVLKEQWAWIWTSAGSGTHAPQEAAQTAIPPRATHLLSSTTLTR